MRFYAWSPTSGGEATLLHRGRTRLLRGTPTSCEGQACRYDCGFRPSRSPKPVHDDHQIGHGDRSEATLVGMTGWPPPERWGARLRAWVRVESQRGLAATARQNPTWQPSRSM